jgi:UDP-N-acetyl-D-glucosamine dehydrogenase
MPMWVIGKLADALNNHGKALKGSRVLVLGLAYKKNVDDPRESPSIELMEILQEKGALVAYSDPHIPAFPRMRKHHFDLKSLELTPDTLARYDCVLLATNHDAFDYETIAKHAQLIVDTRGVYTRPAANIVRA